MTKTRKQIRVKRDRPGPLPSRKAGPTVSTASDNGTDGSGSMPASIPILNKLSSLDVDDRAWTASAIAHLAAENQQTRQLLLANNVIGELSKAMADPNPEIAVEIIGALRNLALEDEVNILEEMKMKNVFDLLLSHLIRIAEALLPNQIQPDITADEKAVPLYRLAEQCLLLLLSFLQFSEQCMSSVAASSSILNFMIYASFPNHNIPTPVITASLHCLNVLADDAESSLISSLHESHPDLITSLLDVASEGSYGFNAFDDDNRMMVRVLAANLVCNLAAARESKLQVFTNAVLPAVISALSSFDLAGCLGRGAELEKEFEIDVVSKAVNGSISNSGESAPEGDMVEDERQTYAEEVSPSGKVLKAQSAISVLESHFVTVHYALELLANALADTSSSDWADIESGREVCDIAMMDHSEAIEQDDDASSDLMAQVMTQSAPTLVPLLASLCQLGCLRISPSPNPACLSSSMQGTRVRALSCMETLTMGLDKSWFESKNCQEITAMWSWLADIANHCSSTDGGNGASDLESVESCVGVMWAFCRGLTGSSVQIVYTDQQLDALISLCTYSNNPPSLIIKALHVLSLLVSRPSHMLQNKKVGLVLLALIGSSSPEVVFEALDAIFDVYADASFDYDAPVFVGMGFLKRLKDSVEIVKDKVKNVDRKKDKWVGLDPRDYACYSASDVAVP
ncbi:hypothetical protein SeMB42_g00182 [Synchytrium endobioticum]|uniref:SYO1-like TPR repeats domain-containing protein n=1 Tax=Synchytrium endobioticum TaxID=286115 RepID=A0A507DUU1_9FUNG|nr:hypothetical protein SeMB42_g00182 [Synchytrium endobioticum]